MSPLGATLTRPVLGFLQLVVLRDERRLGSDPPCEPLRSTEQPLDSQQLAEPQQHEGSPDTDDDADQQMESDLVDSQTQEHDPRRRHEEDVRNEDRHGPLADVLENLCPPIGASWQTRPVKRPGFVGDS